MSSSSNSSEGSSDGSLSRKALITGSVAAGTYVAGALARRFRRQSLPPPHQLPKAIDTDTETFELMEGQANIYVRPGTGTPVVLIHSFNAAASSFEMAPIFDHVAATTDRPIYAVDWLGFGRSDRPPIKYRPELYQRQLRRFLSEHLQDAADVIALSLGSEYAASVALEAPILIRRLVLLNPTGLGGKRGPSTVGRISIKLAGSVGLFELFFYQLTRRATLRRFYERQIFLDSDLIPDELIEYAHTTTHAKGAHRAPRYFVDGTLFPPSPAISRYARLYRPTLLLTPQDATDTVQRFERTEQVLRENDDSLHHHQLPGGLLPHWEEPEPCFDALDAFLFSDTDHE